MSNLSVIVLAAGLGKRMRSDVPKVLHPLAGRPLLAHVVRAAKALEPALTIVVYGHGGERVPEELSHLEVAWVRQEEQLGTGHAVAQAMRLVEDGATVLVLYGDVPLIEARTLETVVRCVTADALGLLTAVLDDPTGYGRIVRDAAGNVLGIVEEKDATPAERDIREINTGILAAPAARLRAWLSRLERDNVQGELYLTDVVGFAVRDGVRVRSVQAGSATEVLGVNDRIQLARLERRYQEAEAARLMRAGVTLLDPARLDVRGEVVSGHDVSIDVNVILEGRVVLGDRVRIGPNTVIKDTEIGEGTEILANCVIEGSLIGRSCRVGPHSRMRPGARLNDEVHIGNFVEIKNSTIEDRSKINHLSYVGDSEVGRAVNIGAGTITCNYDGANKYRTIIEDNVFIGSGTELVAPVTVAAGATIGAGSTITHDCPPDALTLSRVRQTTVEGWRRPTKK